MTDVIKKLITPKNSPINEAIPYIYVENFFTPISVQMYKYPYTTQERYAINKYYAP